MFIRHCPSRDLALTFRSKTIDKWSAREVQEVLDEFHLEKGLKSSAERGSRINMNKAELNSNAAPPSEIHEKQSVSQDTSTLERLIGMLEKVLLQGPSYAQANKKPHVNNRLPKIEGLSDMPCSICSDSSHCPHTLPREQTMLPLSPTWPLETHLPTGETPFSPWSAGKLNDPRTGEDSVDQVNEPPPWI